MKPSLFPSIDDEGLREALKAKGAPLLVSFWAPWNGSSPMLEGTLNELAYDYQKRVDFRVLNVDENAHAPAVYGIRHVPHMVLFRDGEAVASFSGAQPKAKLVEILESYLSS